jgi:hypothetical protein
VYGVLGLAGKNTPNRRVRPSLKKRKIVSGVGGIGGIGSERFCLLRQG